MTRHTHETAPTQFVEASGIRFAYRRVGLTRGVPLVFLQHLTGTMDSWDPLVVDGFAEKRPVVVFDNAGVSRTDGETPTTVAAMAEHVAAFIQALQLGKVDLLGFSLGGFVAQVLAGRHPGIVRRLILAGTGPEGGQGIARIGAVVAEGIRQSPAQPRLHLFFEQSESSQRAGRDFIERLAQRSVDSGPDISDASLSAQLEAITAWGASPSAEATLRLQSITQPVLVVNGKTDLMVPTPNSYALFEQLPDARLILWPDSGHGALFQYADQFVSDGLQFLQGDR